MASGHVHTVSLHEAKVMLDLAICVQLLTLWQIWSPVNRGMFATQMRAWITSRDFTNPSTDPRNRKLPRLDL
jgi:hypothetical protein